MRSISALLILAAVLASPAAEACSFFLVARDGQVLAGNNEDWEDPYVQVRFAPADESGFGFVSFGFSNGFPQGGLNERGLFFDGAATRYLKIVEGAERPAFEGNLIVKALRECATVPEVIALFKRYRLAPLLERAQLMFGDASGDAVIIEGDAMVRKSGDHQICTNFYQSQHRSGPPPCARYQRIAKVLSSTKTLDRELMRRALKAGHQTGRFPTVYSNIYDLAARSVVIYQFHDFDTPAVLDLATELKKGPRTIDLASLFPKNPKLEARRKSFRRGIAFRFRSLMQTQGFDAAVADYRRIKELEPERFRLDEKALLEVASLLWQDKRYDSVDRFLRWMLKEPCPGSTTARIYRGECALKRGRQDEARAIFEAALKLELSAEHAAHARARVKALTPH